MAPARSMTTTSRTLLLLLLLTSLTPSEEFVACGNSRFEASNALCNSKTSCGSLHAARMPSRLCQNHLTLLEADREISKGDGEIEVYTFRVPRVSIEYCSRCNWMLRSAWLSQELLQTFNGTVNEVAMQPNHAGGIFVVRLITQEGEYIIWDRAAQGRFPESRELKQAIRDVLDPARSLGHSDRKELQPSEADLKEEHRGSAQTAVKRLLSFLSNRS